MIRLILFFNIIIYVNCQFSTTTTISTTTTTTNLYTLPTTPNINFPNIFENSSSSGAVTLIPGITIDTSLISKFYDDEALDDLTSHLPYTDQLQINQIRGNIFLTKQQQEQQIDDFLSKQNRNLYQTYIELKNATNNLKQNITNSMSTLSEPARNFINNRNEILDNKTTGIFELNGKLLTLVNEFNTYDNSLKNEIYNFLYTYQLKNFTTHIDLVSKPIVQLNETIENNLMNFVYIDAAKIPIKSFVDLLPQQQQGEFNNIINNSNLRKEQVLNQLQQLVNTWGPQYSAAFNNTLAQRDQMMQLLMFLSEGLTEPYKTFVDKKVELLNNLTITPLQESQAMQTLISSFSTTRNALKQFINNNNNNSLPLIG